MTDFAYRARNSTGAMVTGTVDAASIAEAGRKLANEQGLFLLDLSPAKGRGAGARAGASSQRSRGGRMKRQDVVDFATQLEVMIDTGVPLSEALESLGRQTRDPNIAYTLRGVSDDVQAGASFSDALAGHPKAFPPVMVALCRAGEASGTMGTSLKQIASYLAKQLETTKKVRGALMYPAFMMLMCVGVTIFIMTGVLPKFAEIYGNRGATLPAPTRMLLAMSDWLTTHWMALAGGAAAAVVLAIIWGRTRLGRRQIDWLGLHVPIVAKILHGMYLSRSCRTMATMIQSGLPLLEATAVVRDVANNGYYQELWDQVSHDIEHGEQLADSLKQSPLMPDSVVTMVYSGEKSGRLASVFARLASFAEEELDRRIKEATQFIEPAMTIVMGGIIGFIVIAMLIPIFTVGRVMAG